MVGWLMNHLQPVAIVELGEQCQNNVMNHEGRDKRRSLIVIEAYGGL
jgi:hypothetical protein